MCGIIGLFLKDDKLNCNLGSMLSSMLNTMSDRGPDSSGLAIYNCRDIDKIKLTLRSENHQEDFKEILAANQKMNELVSVLKKDLDDLDNRFNKGGRDFGKVAIEKTDAINRIINKGSDNATRCIEISSGAELTEEERNATKKSEINRECPGIANPNYVPY